MTLIAILTGTLAAGIGSVWLAALLSFGILARYTTHMLSLAAGALLATAFMHLLPEAFESQAGAQELFATLLVGLVFFFLLDKAELYHHGHEHHDPEAGEAGLGELLAPVRTGNSVHAEHVHTSPGALAHGHGHHHHSHPARSGSWAVLTGDSVHAFGDGILIASAFVADMRLGVITALAVLAHEVPHHMGDLVVLRQTSSNRSAALVKVSLAGAVTALGGLVGYALVDMLHDWLPYFLVVASSSFVYVALADLIPQLQKRLSARETFAQIAWLAVGMTLVTVVSGLAHSH
jgi:zinc and cadmium transporter